VLAKPNRGPGLVRVALAGNPNAGKTTLFNALTGLRAKTANFPGTTVEVRVGRMTVANQTIEVLDLPGLYTLLAATSEERVAADALRGLIPGHEKPTVVLLILDATNLERNLFLAGQVLELNEPTVVALNMYDLAVKQGINIDVQALSRELGCPVIPTSARTGEGLEQLKTELAKLIAAPVPEQPPIPDANKCGGCSTSGDCPFTARYSWAEKVGSRCVTATPVTPGSLTEKIDDILTHPVVGIAAFLTVMVAVFTMIFWIAQFPMDWIDGLFSQAGAFAAAHLPEGDLQNLLVKGLIGGVGGTLIFLPQICILFFFLSLLEDTGYLARAAFVMDRLMRRVGLPGKAFVPLLSAHACAVPAIMSTRVIDDKRDRLVTILIAPLMSCSARIPVYTMVTALLFPDRPFIAALLFTGAYTLGMVAAFGVAAVMKRTILPGESKPLVLELPSYKLPSLRTALLTMLDRAWVFITKAGSVIVVISMILWALSTYPKSEPPQEATDKIVEAHAAQQAGNVELAKTLNDDADHLIAQSALSNSVAGRIGRTFEPVLTPLGFDWQIGVGIVSSFWAREVIVSTLAIVYGVGENAADEKPDSLYDTLRAAKRTDGSPVFTAATCVSLLIFYVLAMQCTATLAIVKRETGSWKWPLIQLGYMTALAYAASFIAYQSLVALGVG
jgi:ferrous iron transport protein B